MIRSHPSGSKWEFQAKHCYDGTRIGCRALDLGGEIPPGTLPSPLATSRTAPRRTRRPRSQRGDRDFRAINVSRRSQLASQRPPSHSDRISVSPATAAATLRAQRDAELRAASIRADTLRALFPAAAAVLYGLGATRVWAFGSLVDGVPHERSDVDLAVAGLPGEAFAAALGKLSRLFPCEVDLFAVERAAPTFADRIVSEGIVL